MRELGGGRSGLATAMAVIALTCGFAALDGAQARHRVHHGHHVRHVRHATASHGYTPPYSAMVVDANTGRVLHAVSENEPRHPASITKVMTLYLLFEQLEKGRMTLDSEIPITAHAASMAPSKLGLRPGATITVEHAIKAIVTKSANDIAVAVGEAIGGSEEHFAELMTAKAHALGMNGTHYENASGLPDAEQITTAHDLVLLGRAIQERFPRYYAYFSTHQFNFAGQTLRNHNHLLDKVEGMDGIKTGYTNASGFNLLTSVKRGGKRIVAVVLGGRSAGIRDHIMADLIEEQIDRGSAVRTASALGESATTEREETVRAEPPKPEPIRLVPVEKREVAAAPKPETAKPMPLSLVSPPAPIPAPVVEKARPAVVANAARASSEDRTASIPDGSTRPVSASVSTGATNSGMRWVSGPTGAPAKPAALAGKHANVETRVARVEPVREIHAAKTEPTRPAAAHSGVMIQIGAAEDADRANELLARAKSRDAALAHATPFTEKVQKGSGTLWRARFAGLSESQADSACKTLKRTGFSCFTTRN